MNRVRDVLSNRVVFGTTSEVGRLFMRCHDCQRVVPAWQLLKATPGGLTGCRCGSTYVRPKAIPTWLAGWWIFVRGLLIRKWIKRDVNWDPRVPWRQRA